MTFAIMLFHNPRLLAFCISTTPSYFTPLSSNNICRLSIQSVLFLPQLLLPTIFPVKARFSRPSLRVMWPMNFNCLIKISLIIFLCTPASFRTSSLLTLSVQRIFIILLKNHISQLSKRFLVSEAKVHVSLPCISTG